MTRRRDEARLIREFLAEAEDLLARAAKGLDELAEARDDPPPEVVNALFRAVHSLKGLAGMIGVTHLMDAGHAFESLLDGVRMGRVPVDEITLSASRAAVSALDEMVGAIARGIANPEAPPRLQQRLGEALGPHAAAVRRGTGREGATSRAAHVEPGRRALALPDALAALLTDYERHRLQEAQLRSRKVVLLPVEFSLESFDEGLRRAMDEVRASGELIGTFPGPAGEPEKMCFVLLAAFPPQVDEEAVAQAAGALECTRVDEPAGSAAPAELPSTTAGSAEASAEPTERPDVMPLFSSETVRVPLERLAGLLDLAGDLALAARSHEQALSRALPLLSDRMLRHDLQKSVSQLQRTAASVSRAVLGLRLVPVEQLADRLSRAVRTIAAAQGKEVELEVVGGETELDKVLADELAEPLLHMLRNAVDHGIESPSERISAGKPAAGRVRLSAEARGREVLLTVSDDGRGIDPANVVRRARERGLLSRDAESADPLSLIFLPGFSTASEVSEISGRGVGLDVVRAALAGLKGSVSVRSERGRGARFEVLVPVTLAMVESLLVEASGRFFALPSSGVTRTFALPAEGPTGSPGEIEDGDRRLPLVPLGQLLGLGGAEDGRTVVVAEQGDARAGILVTEIEGLFDLVIKPLPEEIPRAAEVSGAAELPDGQLALVLDTGRLLARVPVLNRATPGAA